MTKSCKVYEQCELLEIMFRSQEGPNCKSQSCAIIMHKPLMKVVNKIIGIL